MKRISVVLATYNRLAKLTLVLEYLFNQDFKGDYEVIVVDNGSTDGTIKYLKDLKQDNLKLIEHGLGNIGPARARNLGVKHSKFDYLAFTDDDCLVSQDWLAKIAEAFEKDNDLTAVGGSIRATEELVKSNIFAQYELFNERFRYHVTDTPHYSTKRDELPFQTNNIAYKKDKFLLLKGFDETFGIASGEDGDLKERALKKGYEFLYIPIFVTHIQDYNIKRFWQQCIIRGAGIMEYRIRHHQHVPSRFEIWLMFLWAPLEFLQNVLRYPFRIALIESLAYFGRNVGKLKYLAGFR